MRSDSVGYTKDDLGELVLTIETASAFFRGLGQFEDHGERCLVGKTSVGTHRAVADRRERAFDDIGRAQMLPVLGNRRRRAAFVPAVQHENKAAMFGKQRQVPRTHALKTRPSAEVPVALDD